MPSATPNASARPLEGVTVLDLSRVLAGPFCTMLLAQLGARVIKVESPGLGDDSRAFGPFVNGKSLYFASINYDKESIALNLKEQADRASLRSSSASRTSWWRIFAPARWRSWVMAGTRCTSDILT